MLSLSTIRRLTEVKLFPLCQLSDASITVMLHTKAHFTTIKHYRKFMGGLYRYIIFLYSGVSLREFCCDNDTLPEQPSSSLSGSQCWLTVYEQQSPSARQ